MRNIASIIATISTMLVAASICLACDCITLSPAESFKEADFVFVGSVITSDVSSPPANATSVVTTATFRIDQVLKGPPTDQVKITGHMTDCDFLFQTGYAYIVYARQAEGKLLASACMSNRALQTPGAQEPIIRDTSSPRLGYRLIIAGVILLFAFVVGYIVGRAWPRSA